MMSTPLVMVYRVSPLTYALGKPRIKVPYFAMVNLIAGQTIVPEFRQLAVDYPEEFQRYFGSVSPESFAHALRVGKATYIAEACWHCHSQFVRPVSKEDLRFGPVSTPAEYQNMMNLPHLFGTRRVGPDLIRENGKHSNDWHVAHLYDPRSVAPYSEFRCVITFTIPPIAPVP